MKKLILGCVLPVVLLAADFWQSKPFAEWSSKEAQRVLEDSPWARPFYVPVEVAPPGGKGKHRGMGEVDAPVNPATGGGVAPMEDEAGAARQLPLTVRWQSAMAVKQAVVRLRFGAEAGNSGEARKILEGDLAEYVIAVEGLTPAMTGRDLASLNKSLLEQCSLTTKGKAALKASSIEFRRGAKGTDAYFLFPKSVEFTVTDKDVEFNARFPMFAVNQRFRLKDMALNGKLAL